MADHLDPDSAPQRKRIAVAVSSREAPLRPDAADFGYSLPDARMYANKPTVGGGLAYTHELSTLGSSSYAYTPAPKASTYFPAMHAYGTPYPEDFEFALGVSGHTAAPLNACTEPVAIMPNQWSSSPRPKLPSYSNMYVDPDGPYNSYSGAGLLHRCQQVSSDSSSLSFSGVAASLPERLLPTPVGRSSTVQYTHGPVGAGKTPGQSSAAAASTLADVAATAANYASGFDAFSSATSSSLSSHPSSRANSDAAYSTAESIFSDQERSLQSQGPAFDMSGYTTSPRRGSVAGSGGGSAGEGTSSARGPGSYGPGSNIHDTQSQQQQQEQPSPSHHHGHLVTAGAAIEAAIEDWDQHGISDNLTLALSSLLSQPLPTETEAAQQREYVVYHLSLLRGQSELGHTTPRINLLESRSLIAASGTTGLRTWEAALHLGQYLCTYPSLVANKRVLELGSGTGYLAVLCAKYLRSSRVIATDGSDEVVNRLSDSFFLNGLQEYPKASAAQLKWGHSFVGADWMEEGVDTVLGADITYDVCVIPALVATIDDMARQFRGLSVLIAATERNRVTFEKFLGVCEKRGFTVSHEPFPVPPRSEQDGPFYSDASPIHICKLST
ncbi:hypothetical protein VTJ49DRAFT_3823 [Mycothermus thermophilus]|uniref:Uncharacterized protein n=1 Tax=Humicola insolens TaxID=85995 RepID=A0ABR3VQI5_HUMIN